MNFPKTSFPLLDEGIKIIIDNEKQRKFTELLADSDKCLQAIKKPADEINELIEK